MRKPAHEAHWTPQVFHAQPDYAGIEFDLWSNCTHEIYSARPDVIEPDGRLVKGLTNKPPQGELQRGEYIGGGTFRSTTPPQDASDGSKEELHQRVLWEAVVMAYGRCFTTGKGYLQPGAQRTKVPADYLESFDADELRVHEEVPRERNQHIGHRAGDQEQAKVILVLNPPPDERAVAGVAILGVRLVALTGDDLAVLRRLAQKLADQLRADYKLINDALVVECSQHLDEWYSRAVPMD